MVKTFCDRCGKETTGEKHGAIHGIGDADDNGGGTNDAPDCFDIVCDDCFEAWQAWMKLDRSNDLEALAGAMKKMLPPAVLADVVAHLDPLTPFVEFLRRKDLEQA